VYPRVFSISVLNCISVVPSQCSIASYFANGLNSIPHNLKQPTYTFSYINLREFLNKIILIHKTICLYLPSKRLSPDEGNFPNLFNHSSSVRLLFSKRPSSSCQLTFYFPNIPLNYPILSRCLTFPNLPRQLSLIFQIFQTSIANSPIAFCFLNLPHQPPSINQIFLKILPAVSHFLYVCSCPAIVPLISQTSRHLANCPSFFMSTFSSYH
jgi:hypothetical protein